MKKILAVAFATILSTVCLTSTVNAQTLDAIQKRGKVIIAVDTSTPPYGMLDEKMQPVGLDVDMARLIAQDLGVPLEITQVSGPNRIPFLISGKVDLVVATFGVTAERAKTVNFTIPYATNQETVFGKAGTEVTGMESLKGKSIATVRGSTQDLIISRRAPQGTTVRRYEDDAAASNALLAGQVDLIITSEKIGNAIIAKDNTNSLEKKFVASISPFSIGIRKGDLDFLQFLNTAIYTHRNNGDLAGLHAKWIKGDMPALPSF